MKANSQLVSVFIAILALTVYFTILSPIVAIAGEAEAQKTIYVANDLALLIETAAFLPEDSNFLLPDVLDATAALSQGRLIVEGDTTKIPPLTLPSSVNLKESKVDLENSFLYVSKEGSFVQLTGSQTDDCIKIENNYPRQIRIIALTNQEENLAKNIQDTLNDLSPSIKKSGDLSVGLLAATQNQIIVGTGLTRRQSSLSCFLTKEFNYERVPDDRYPGQIIITYSQESETEVLQNTVFAVEEFYE